MISAVQWFTSYFTAAPSAVVEPQEIVLEKEKNDEEKLHLLVFVNPKSGSGNALIEFQREVTPIFAKKGVTFELVVTERAGHCTDFLLKKPDFKEYDGIIGVGGDGTPFEIVQALFQKLSLDLAVGHIPSGSGNGLAMSLLILKDRSYGVKEAARMICKGITMNVDVMQISSAGKEYLSFLTLSWGVVSSLDIRSEKFRFLGGHRFILGALMELWKNQAYKGKLSYLPAGNPEVEIPKLNEDLPREFKHIKGPFTLILACNTTHCSYNAHTAPAADLQDGYVLLTYVKHCDRWTLLKMLMGFENGSYLKMPCVKQIKTRAFRIIPKSSEGILTVDGEVVPCRLAQCKVEQQALKVFCS